MEEPHGEAVELQRLAPAAIDGDAAGPREHGAGRIDSVVVDATEHLAQLVERDAEQIGFASRS